VPGFWFLLKRQIDISGDFAVNNEEYEGFIILMFTGVD
jgi:hypothetical protein